MALLCQNTELLDPTALKVAELQYEWERSRAFLSELEAGLCEHPAVCGAQPTVADAAQAHQASAENSQSYEGDVTLSPSAKTNVGHLSCASDCEVTSAQLHRHSRGSRTEGATPHAWVARQIPVSKVVIGFAHGEGQSDDDDAFDASSAATHPGALPAAALPRLPPHTQRTTSIHPRAPTLQFRAQFHRASSYSSHENGGSEQALFQRQPAAFVTAATTMKSLDASEAAVPSAPRRTSVDFDLMRRHHALVPSMPAASLRPTSLESAVWSAQATARGPGIPPSPSSHWQEGANGDSASSRACGRTTAGVQPPPAAAELPPLHNHLTSRHTSEPAVWIATVAPKSTHGSPADTATKHWSQPPPFLGPCLQVFGARTSGISEADGVEAAAGPDTPPTAHHHRAVGAHLQVHHHQHQLHLHNQMRSPSISPEYHMIGSPPISAAAMRLLRSPQQQPDAQAAAAAAIFAAAGASRNAPPTMLRATPFASMRLQGVPEAEANELGMCSSPGQLKPLAPRTPGA